MKWVLTLPEWLKRNTQLNWLSVYQISFRMPERSDLIRARSTSGCTQRPSLVNLKIRISPKICQTWPKISRAATSLGLKPQLQIVALTPLIWVTMTLRTKDEAFREHEHHHSIQCSMPMMITVDSEIRGYLTDSSQIYTDNNATE